MQLAYTLGEFKHPTAGKLLGLLTVRSNGDAYHCRGRDEFTASRQSGRFLTEVVKKGTRADRTVAAIARPGDGLQSRAFADRVADSSDRTGRRQKQLCHVAIFGHRTILDRWSGVGIRSIKWLSGLKSESKPLAARLQSLFAAARTLATNGDATVADRVAAVRVLGQSTDQDADARC